MKFYLIPIILFASALCVRAQSTLPAADVEKATPAINVVDVLQNESAKKCDATHTDCCMHTSTTETVLGEKGAACGTMIIGMSAKKEDVVPAK